MTSNPLAMASNLLPYRPYSDGLPPMVSSREGIPETNVCMGGLPLGISSVSLIITLKESSAILKFLGGLTKEGLGGRPFENRDIT